MKNYFYVKDGVLCSIDEHPVTPQDVVEKFNELVKLNESLRHRLDLANNQIDEWKDASGLECGGDPDGVTPSKAKKFWKDKAEAFRKQEIEYQVDIVALRHDLEVAEFELDQAKKELKKLREI